MALKSTIFKVELQVADMDRSYYADHALTIARHPSENDERMMVRVLAYALFAQEGLAFGNGLSTNDEPDLWKRDLTGEVELWIDVGQPDEKLVRKAGHRSREVVVLCFGRVAEVWWAQNRGALERIANLRVMHVAADAVEQLAGLVQRSMRLQCNVQDGQIWLGDAERSAQLEVATWKTPS